MGKTDFQTVLWADEARLLDLNGADGWSKGWVQKGSNLRLRYKRQQGGGGIMIWAGIIGNQVVGPFLVPDGLKMNSGNYCSFLEANFLRWMNSQTDDVKQSFIFQQNNAPSHASRTTKGWLADQGITRERIMDWSPQSPDLSPIENMWSIIKRKVYENRHKFGRKKTYGRRLRRNQLKYHRK